MTDLTPIDTQLLPQDMTVCEIEGIKQETDKAVLVDFGDCEHWIPKSCCEYGVEKDSGLLIVAIKDWKYNELGL